MNEADVLDTAEVLELVRERGHQGIPLAQLVDWVVTTRSLDRARARTTLRRGLRKLQGEGLVTRIRGKRYRALEASDLATGVLRLLSSGAGVVTPEDGSEAIRVARHDLRGVIDRDRVLLRRKHPRARAGARSQPEGVVVRVLERTRPTVVGRYLCDGTHRWVRPLQANLGFKVRVTGSMISSEPEHAELVAVRLETVSHHSGRASGVLVDRLGRAGDPGVDERVACALYDIEEELPDDAVAQARALSSELTDEDLVGRWDLRDRAAVTVDPATARDFDDAVSASRGKHGDIVVEVHIADVSHFVEECSPLDRAAERRSTSVYFPSRAIHMLPQELSTDICSLAPLVDRLTFTARFTVQPDGTISHADAHPSVIRSRRRCTYEEVADWLEHEPGQWPEETAEFRNSLLLCAEAAQRLAGARRRRGSLDFDLAEPRLVLSPDGEVTAVEPAPRTRAHRMIEELMVAANHCVAAMLVEHEQPALHRVHDEPEPQRLLELGATLTALGMSPRGGASPMTVKQLQELLDSVAGNPAERLVSTLVLRSMARAVYSPEPRGHFALATDAYTHFTSPIRRYPDLCVHRSLRRLLLEQSLDEEARCRREHSLVELGGHCSEREQSAEAAERMVVQWRIVRFLAGRVGEVFAGCISGVTEFGLFVQLDDLAVDGLMHISELTDDYYELDPVLHRLVGTRSRRCWRLGDAVTVRLARVDEMMMQVQLVPVDITPDRSRIPVGNAVPRQRARSARQHSGAKRGSTRRPAQSKRSRRTGKRG